MDYKAAKEEFVTGLTGTSKLEIFALTSTLPLTVIICEHATRAKAPMRRLVLELAIIVSPHLLLCTEAIPLGPTFAACLLLATACLLWTVVRPDRTHAERALRLDDLVGKRKSFLSVFRGALMLATCISILAVDFRTFPRRYAKTEVYGTGYMDLGVGGIILVAGAVSLAAAGPAADSLGGPSGAWKPEPLWRRVCASLRAAAACWVLALARLLSVRAVDYQAHVGEYGVHWNFFATISLVSLLGRLGPPPSRALLPAAVAVTAAHQAALSLGGLGPWVMSPHRDSDLISLNKEGLVSCIGFWALYLWGAALSYHTHLALQSAVRQTRRTAAVPKSSQPPPLAVARKRVEGGGIKVGGTGISCDGRRGDREHHREWWLEDVKMRVAAVAPLLRCVLHFAAADGLLWVAVAALEAYVEPISRRSCNAAYVMWVAAQCVAWALPLLLGQALQTALGACGDTSRGDNGSGNGNVNGNSNRGSSGGGSDGAMSGAMQAAEGRAAGGGGGRISGGVVAAGNGVAGSATTAASAAASRRGGSATAGPVGPAGGGCGDGGRVSTPTPQLPPSRAPPSADSWGPLVLQAINRNQLAVFLLANLLTGAVNLFMNTLQVPDRPARALLGAYITLVCVVAVFLNARGWRLKL